MSSPIIPRRTFLTGLGTTMALPFLEAMMPLGANAQSGKLKDYPVRMAFLFVPNGAHMEDWTPKTEGRGYQLPYILEPLKPVRDSISVLTGLTQDKARPNGDGAGDHARSCSAWLTGCQPRKTAGADIKAGISADQVAAQFIGKKTRFPSLEIGIERGAQAGNCDSGYSCAYSNSISWRGESTPVAKEVDPRLVFERLFGNGDDNEMAESRAKRDSNRKSILDFVMEDAAALKSKLGSHDQRKLDEYFSSVRDIEHRLAGAGASAAAQGRDASGKPTGIPADMGEHIRLMGDMMVLAFQGDLTRICTFMFANEGSNRPYRTIGIPEGHHDLSHHGRDPQKQSKIRDINRFHVAQLAYILQKMQSIQEGGRTLLDNTVLIYGGGIGDGDRHNHDDLPILLCGRGGGNIPSGRHIIYPRNTPMNNLFVSLLDRQGITIDKLGDSTGKLQGLF